MTPKTFIGLAAVVVVAIGAAAVALVVDLRSTAFSGVAGEAAFPALAANPDSAAKIAIRSPFFQLNLVRSGDGWLMADRGNYPVHASSVAQIVSGLAQMKIYERKTTKVDWFKEVGVEDPSSPGAKSTLITVSGKNGEALANTIVGNVSHSIGADPLGGTFIRRPDQQQALLAEGTVTLPSDFTSWFDQIVHVPGPDVARISIFEDGQLVFKAIKRNDSASTFGLDTHAEKYGYQTKLAAIDSAVKLLDLGIVSTTFDDVKAVGDIAFTPNDRRVRFETNDGMALELQLAKDKDGKVWVKYTATAEGNPAGQTRAKEISKNTDGFAFLLPKYRTDPLGVAVSSLVQTPPPVQAPAANQAPRVNDIPLLRAPPVLGGGR